MRCFFHLVNDRISIPDDIGVESADLETAARQAIATLHDLWVEDPGTTDDWSGWSLNIADGTGITQISTSLGDLTQGLWVRIQ
ncbi:DUF6894 family protein [Microvirga sp. 2TAF3]|uniref:DUF6894 family protein n=1 Tax=Microvirga sp. 2TAF3 TaxID=3233014 RepID=UPI003F97FCCE